MKKLTKEEFIARAKDVHGDKYDYTNIHYINTRTKITIFCPEHGEFLQTPNAHLSGQGCPICGNAAKIDKLKLSIEDVLYRFKSIHGDKYSYDFSNYENVKSNISIKCNKHDYWFKQKVYHHLNGNGCPICNRGVKYSTNEFIIKARSVHGDLYDYSRVNYVNKNVPVEIICHKHGIFLQKPHDHISGCGCQKCKSWKTQYKIFEFLTKEFSEINWKWEYSPKWLGLQKFDIYCIEYNFAVEFNGIQHYEPVKTFGDIDGFKSTQKRDRLKLQKCIENNCTLYVIKYDDVNYDKIREDINKLINNNYAN